MQWIIFVSLIIVLILIPSVWWQLLISKVYQRYTRRSLVCCGESLYLWMDSFGLTSSGVDLARALPEEDLYKEFSKQVHMVWLHVQKNGGQISLYFKVIKALLREDIKRTQKEVNQLRDFGAQVFFMCFFVWLFNITFRVIGEVPLSKLYYLMVALWQGAGLLGLFFFIKRKRAHFFAPNDFLSSCLLDLYSIYFKGELASVALGECTLKLTRFEMNLYERMQRSLINWQHQGHVPLASIDDLKSDVIVLSQERGQIFLQKLKGYTFLWSCVFILPTLFSAVFFGLHSLVKL